MVFTLLQRAILVTFLLPLCTRSVEDEKVNIKTLGRIQKFFRNNYFKDGQYAVAINVPKEQCQADFNPQTDGFLIDDTGDEVKAVIGSYKKSVYNGNQLIAAGFDIDAHSEFLLMNPAEPYWTDLLNKNKDGCVVFYTLNSPCIDACLQSKIILSGLDKLKDYEGIKAFAFTHIYEKDKKKHYLSRELKKISARVPLYRCSNGCILCGEPGSDINEACLSP